MQFDFNLKHVLDIGEWQCLQDRLAAETGLAMITVDYKGAPVTTHSCRSSFCTAIRNDPVLSRNCEKCDSRGGIESARIDGPYVYLCHYGILDAALPLTLDGKYIGALMVGQVVLTDGQVQSDLERICLPAQDAESQRKVDAIRAEYESLPRMPYARVNMILQMLFGMCRYVMNRYRKNAGPAAGDGTAAGLPLPEGLEAAAVHAPPAEAGYRVLKLTPDERFVVCNEVKNPVLAPAIELIGDIKYSSLTMTEAARTCHLSASYFSKLFAREMGENFSSYMTRLKVYRAKQLLASTDFNVGEVSEILGFKDDGYFIRIFKRHEGLTPAVYRKYAQGRM